MAKDVGDLIGTAIGRVARETVQSVAANKRGKGSPLSGGKGLAAGAGLASLAPLAYKGAKGAKNLMSGGSSNGSGPVGKAKEKLEGNVKDRAKEGAKDALPFGGGKDKGEAGVGKGRRMPIQQSMDVPVDIKTVYNEWTQFEEWPEFMHRLESVSQDDETHVHFKTKIWGKSKEFKAEIVEQRPDERIKWEVNEGVTHTGVVTFHEIAPRLTRVEVNIDVQPGSLIEKAARGMRHVKRAVRADMHRFKAYVMMNEEESGAWRGTIDDGEVKSRVASAASRSRSRSSGSSGSSSSRRRSGSSPSRRKASSAKSSGSSSRGKASPAKSSGSSARSKASSSKNGASSSRGKASSNGRTTASRSASSNGRKKSGARS